MSSKPVIGAMGVTADSQSALVMVIPVTGIGDTRDTATTMTILIPGRAIIIGRDTRTTHLSGTTAAIGATGMIVMSGDGTLNACN